MSRNQDHGTRGFVDLPGLDANQAVFDNVNSPDPLSPATAVQFLDDLQWAEFAAIERNGNTLFKADHDLVRQRRVGGVVRVVVDVLGWSVPNVFQEPGFNGSPPHVLVD